MTWSDAARKAAEETRKAHAAYKKQFSSIGPRNISAPTSAAGRQDIAHSLQRARKGSFTEYHMHEAASGAAASTRLRNAARAAESHTAIHKKK